MTDDTLRKLEALCEAATPPPWVPLLRGSGYAFEALEREPGTFRAADARFIAAAREAVPALVAEVRSARAEAAKWRSHLEAMASGAAGGGERVRQIAADILKHGR